MIYSRLCPVSASFWISCYGRVIDAWYTPYAQVYLPNFSLENSSQLLSPLNMQQRTCPACCLCKSPESYMSLASRQNVAARGLAMSTFLGHFTCHSALSYKLISYVIQMSTMSYVISTSHKLIWHTLTAFTLALHNSQLVVGSDVSKHH